MPHLTLEYSANVTGFDAAGTLLALNTALVASRHFDALDIKSRARALDTFLVGTEPAGHGFVHVTLALLSGRDAATKRALSDALLSALKRCCADERRLRLQLCAEIVEIDRASYAKRTLGAGLSSAR